MYADGIVIITDADKKMKELVKVWVDDDGTFKSHM